jgi:hypothetical protein
MRCETLRDSLSFVRPEAEAEERVPSIACASVRGPKK